MVLSCFFSCHIHKHIIRRSNLAQPTPFFFTAPHFPLPYSPSFLLPPSFPLSSFLRSRPTGRDTRESIMRALALRFSVLMHKWLCLSTEIATPVSQARNDCPRKNCHCEEDASPTKQSRPTGTSSIVILGCERSELFRGSRNKTSIFYHQSYKIIRIH